MTNLHEIAILTIIIRHNRVLMTSNVNVSDNCFKLKGSYIKILYIGKIQIPVCKMIHFIVGKVKNALLFNSNIIRIITIKDKIIILLKKRYLGISFRSDISNLWFNPSMSKCPLNASTLEKI